jgi:hypothetical protein
MLLVLVFILSALTAVALAASQDIATLQVSGKVPKGTAPGTYKLLECKGHKLKDTSADPWLGITDNNTVGTNCTDQREVAQLSTLAFGDLERFLRDSAGNPTTDSAGYFYSDKVFAIYLYPDAWGGAKYTIKQQVTLSDTDIANAMTVSVLYTPKDKFIYTGKPEGEEQGELTGREPSDNSHLTGDASGTYSKTYKASDLNVETAVFTAQRARIVRLQYGIPPCKEGATECNDSWVMGWLPVSLTKPSTDITGSIKVTFYQD